MNDLNSLLIEGEIIKHMRVGENARWLRIKSRRYVHGDDGKLETRYTELDAVLPGKVADRLAECRPGRVVRLVGRLSKFDSIFMEVEHVEFRSRRSESAKGEI